MKKNFLTRMAGFIKFPVLLRKIRPLYGIAFVIVFLVGYLVRGAGSSGLVDESVHEQRMTESVKDRIWTCSMHPQIRLEKPGQCPICFMDLIPVETDSDGAGPDELKMSQAAVHLAGISTVSVRRGLVRPEIRLAGRITADETRVKTVSTWISGRLERLHVNFTGARVNRGDPLADIYSPALYSAQEEFLQGLRGGGADFPDDGDRFYQEAAREKLRLLGLSDDQINDVEKRGVPEERVAILSPVDGVVIQKYALEGTVVNRGTAIYTVADLERLWVVLDAYEMDIPWLSFGQKVSFTVQAVPGTTFHAVTAFIDPVLNEKTRSVQVRLNIGNRSGLLKPGMFVRAVVRPVLDAGGRSVNPGMAGKWVGPMHPEVVRSGPGRCDICGAELARAEKLGISGLPGKDDLSLLVPASTVLLTGKRALVYVKRPGTGEPVFQAREIRVGPRAGEFYPVVSGLKEGEEVVVKGNFKIDSAMQLSGKPSMINPEGGGPAAERDHSGAGMSVKESGSRAPSAGPVFSGANGDSGRAVRKALWEAYLSLQEALAADEQEEAEKSLALMNEIVEGDKQDAGREWNAFRNRIHEVTRHASHGHSIEEIRKSFEILSTVMKEVLAAFRSPLEEPVYEVFCSMAFDNKGAAWIQRGKTVANPYFGSRMLRCGDIRNEFRPSEETHHAH